MTADPFCLAVLAADPRARRLLAILRALSDAEADAWFRLGQQLAKGAPVFAGASMPAGLDGEGCPGGGAVPGG